MNVRINDIQAKISRKAFDLQKTEAMAAGASLRRLDLSDRSAQDVLGKNAYLSATLSKANIPSDNTYIELDINTGVVSTWLNALLIFHLRITKMDSNAQQLTMLTNVSDRKKATQQMIDQLGDQLQLGVIDIDALSTQLDREGDHEAQEKERKRAEKEAAHEGDNGSAAAPPSKKWDRTHRKAAPAKKASVKKATKKKK